MMYLVHTECGEAFDTSESGIDAATQHTNGTCNTVQFDLVTEEQAF